LTLIELIVAVALFGIVLLGIVPLFLGSMKSNYSGNEYTSVNMLARDRLEQLMNLTFLDPQLNPGAYPSDQSLFLPDPSDPTKLSTVPNPFTITYQVTQWQIPDAGGSPLVIASGASFTPTQILTAGQPYQYKRIDVMVQSNTGTLGLGARMARVAGMINNPSPAGNVSLADPCAALPAQCP
jgi:type II secretory pathway pseudopilin PulG